MTKRIFTYCDMCGTEFPDTDRLDATLTNNFPDPDRVTLGPLDICRDCLGRIMKMRRGT